ncbi:hypothetical protein [Streptomyces otsuchiensis]|uniref:hypothetical protein n=1 Tax=Streptomyces otsuchiensis TaxID=2681388 RepID=UPI00102F3C44|nr:hypothetical protein [Streptomyces otsuchiensis]
MLEYQMHKHHAAELRREVAAARRGRLARTTDAAEPSARAATPAPAERRATRTRLFGGAPRTV